MRDGEGGGGGGGGGEGLKGGRDWKGGRGRNWWGREVGEGGRVY